MKKYGYGRIAKLDRALTEAGISPKVVDQIMAGGDAVKAGSSQAAKGGWLRGAMQRMDDLLDAPTRRAVRESCACCLGGKRLEISKGIARNYASLEERIRAANEAKFVFGHSVTRQEDGTILVSFFPEGQESYRCACLGHVKEPLSITYCYCCGGHVKHHLQTALGRGLACEVRSSSLSSGGKLPCTFALTLLGDETAPPATA